MADAFAELVQLVAVGAARPSRADVADGGAHPAAAADDVAAEVLELLALGAARPRQHEQRSWQLMGRARDAKELKRARAREGAAQQAAQAAASSIAVLDSLFGKSVASSSQSKPKLNDAVRAGLDVALACLPAARGATGKFSKQARVAAKVAAAISDV